MLFNNKDIENEFNRLCKLYPDLPEIKAPLINIADTFRAYFTLADFFTDNSSNNYESMLIGLRSADLLYSALGRQTVSFAGKQKYTEKIDICSTLFFGMVKNHSFSDGNKRTALLTLLYQLNLYGYYPNCPVKDFEKLVIAIAANELPTKYKNYWNRFQDKNDPEIQIISFLLRRMTKKKDHSYHLKISTKDIATALVKYKVTNNVEKGKIHFERKIPKKWYQPQKTLKYTMVFGGWTRCIGAQTAREILTSLELYDQFPD